MPDWFSNYLLSLSYAEKHFHILILLAILVLIGWKAFQTYRRYRFMSDTPTSRIASAAQGYVELKGIGERIAGTEIRSPFSNRRCLWYACRVEKRRITGKSVSWQVLDHEISDEIFYLQDDTGRCIVLPEGAHVIPSQSRQWHGNHYTDRFRPGVSKWFVAGNLGHYRFSEKLILVADPLYVIGFFKSVAKTIPAESLQQQANQLVEQWKKQPIKYLSAFDQDKNGKIQRKEWRLIRQHAMQQVMNNQQKTAYHTIQKTPFEQQPFVISAVSEKELIKRKFYRLLFYSVSFLLLFSILLMILQLDT